MRCFRLGQMASGRIMALSTAVKIARRMTALKQWGGIPPTNDLSTAAEQWRGIPQWSTIKCRSIHSNPNKKKKDRLSTNTRHDFGEGGYTDVTDLLSTPERDFLLKNNGQKVAISSLKGKLVGLYFCDNIPYPPRIQAIKKVYEEAKSRGYDFEVVQLTFHYRCNVNAKHLGIDLTVQQCREDISWLTLPLMDPMDPSLQKIERIFESVADLNGESVVDLNGEDRKPHWVGDSLVLVYPHQAQAEAYDSSGVLFEFSGAEILNRWGIEGYPFTRSSLYKAEYELQKREVTLQALFPPGGRLLRRPQSRWRPRSGYDLVDAFPQLWLKRVLVLFASHFAGTHDPGFKFRRMLKSAYRAQLTDTVAEESKFEVVYVSTAIDESGFDESTQDMPWLVLPYSGLEYSGLFCKVLKEDHAHPPAAAAFNKKGELVAKEHQIGGGDMLRFPFINQDLEEYIRGEVDSMCNVAYKRTDFY